jgi:uncharacterized caspase-like protein
MLRNGYGTASFLVVLLSLAAPLEAAEPRKLAFVVGIADYQKDGLSNLRFADDDAEALQRVLRERMGFEVDALLREQATLAEFKQRWAAFLEKTKQLSKQDLVFVSLCGHGIQMEVDRDGKLVSEAFFCPYDARKTDSATLLSISELMASIERDSGSSQNLLAIDACRDDPSRGARGLDGGTVKELPPKLSVLFACAGGQRSYEADQVKHGVFTYVLLDGLKGEAANKRGEITWGNLTAHCQSEVPLKLEELIPDLTTVQRPHLLNNLVSNPILFQMISSDTARPAMISTRPADARPADQGADAGVLLFHSCSPGEVTFEDEAFKHGIFTHFLLEGLRGKAVDASGAITWSSLFQFARVETLRHVEAKHGRRQAPQLLGGDDELKLDFSFRKAGDLQKCRFLLIGISKYPNGFDLAFTAQDATELAETLGGAGAKTRVLTTETLRQPILDAIGQAASECRADETLVVYFSSQGCQVDGKSYVIPSDGVRGDVDTFISIDEVKRLVQSGPARKAVVISDACRNEHEKSR